MTRTVHIHPDHDDPEPLDGYLAVLTLESTVRVGVVVYEVQGCWADDTTTEGAGRLCLPRKGSTFSPDHAASVADAEVWLHGDIMSGGLSNWAFDNGGVMLQFGGPADAAFVGELFRRLYSEAAEMLGDRADFE
jgi:hypothetical protein